jgi:uncharacterized membrane protein (DUF373 family)
MPEEESVINIFKRFERLIIGALIVMMGVVVLLSTVELGWLIIKDIITPPIILLEIDELLDLFGFFLLVLIGLELLETIRSYLEEHVVHAEVVVEVALIAITRKVITLNVKDLPSLTLVGVASIILALTTAYFVLKRWHANKPSTGG